MGYDKHMVADLLMQLAGELKLRQCALTGGPLPEKILPTVTTLRAKYRTNLLPDVENLLSLVDGDQAVAIDTTIKQVEADFDCTIAFYRIAQRLKLVGDV